ncbi:GntR family transcriptional regulator [Micromonosporaceae bacterium Da 78-11]
MSELPELVVVTADPTPPYEQLRRQLAELIRAGSLPAGSRLPPLRQLAGDLGLAVGTVARTYRELETAGLIVSRRGGGTRVAEAPAGPGTAQPGTAQSDTTQLGAARPDGGVRRAAVEYVRRARAEGAHPVAILAAVREALEA